MLLDSVPSNFPALMQALKIQERAARVGFDWDAAAPIHAKITEEFAEFDAALAARDTDAMEDEFGDLLFSLVNLARYHGLDPEKALRRCVLKFRSRFNHIETRLNAQGTALQQASLDEMEELWVEAKHLARGTLPA